VRFTRSSRAASFLLPPERAERLRDDAILDQLHLAVEVDARGAELPRHASAVRRPVARREQMRRQVARLDHAIGTPEDDHLLEDVAQLAHVPRPRVRLRMSSAAGADLEAAAALRRELREDAARDERDVFAASPERRHLDRHDAQPVVEILANWPRGTASSSGRFVAAMMRTSTCCVATLPTGSKRPFSRTRSSFTWSFGLISPISSRKIVPPSASLKRPDAARDGARERAALVTEHLALEEVFRDRTAVDRHELPRLTMRQPVQRGGDELLPVPLSPRDEDGRVPSAPPDGSPRIWLPCSDGIRGCLEGRVRRVVAARSVHPPSPGTSGKQAPRPLRGRTPRSGQDFASKPTGTLTFRVVAAGPTSGPPRHTRRTFVYVSGDSRTRPARRNRTGCGPRLRFRVLAPPRRRVAGARVLREGLAGLLADGR
jgi:hypothetical protein